MAVFYGWKLVYTMLPAGDHDRQNADIAALRALARNVAGRVSDD